MTDHAAYLIGVLFAAIALLVALISSRTKVHPFVALLIVSVLTALAAGESIAQIPKTLASGAGGVLGHVGLVIALGAMLGKLLADSGAVQRIADIVLNHSTPKSAPWVMTAVSFVIGIPMFFEVGLVLLLPVIYAVAVRLEQAHQRPKTWYLRILVPAIAALACLHGMVPPHPGPLIAVSGLHADVGLTIVIGLVCAVPTVILSGPIYAHFIAPRVPLEPPHDLIQQYAGTTPEALAAASEAGASSAGVGAGNTGAAPVPTWLAFACVLIPVALMLLHSLVQLVAPHSAIEPLAKVLGDPTIAMLIGVVFAMLALGRAAHMTGENIRKSFSASLGPIAGIILIIAGGGAFNAVLKDSGIGAAIVQMAGQFQMNVILLGWLVGILLSFATGSATVGIVSATGVVAPLMTGAPPLLVSLVVVAIGAGSIGLNWVNHAGFWFVKEAFGMSIGQATKSHMTVQTLVSVIALGCALLVSLAV